MADNKPRPSGPNGDCCGNCRYSWVLPNSPTKDMVCRLNPPVNMQEMVMDSAAILAPGAQQQPRVQTNVLHTYTFDWEWCGRHERRAKLAAVGGEPS